MTKVLYGKGDTYVDVTNRYLGYIPRTDESRSVLFGGDPLPGIEKEVRLIVDGTETVYRVGDVRLPDNLAALHKKLTLKGGTFSDELDEQVMAALFLKRHHRVLEIGADVGTNSCIISSLCDTPPVTVECNNAIESTLRYNLKNNGLSINLEMGALTKGQLIYRHTTSGCRIGQSTKYLEEGQPVPQGYGLIRSITYQYLVDKYHKFDVVVADCEGAFYYIVKEFPEILDDIEMLIIENDYSTKGHKDYVDKQLIERGFIRIYRNILQFNYNVLHKNNFYEVWQKRAVHVLSNGFNGQYGLSLVDGTALEDRGLHIVYEVKSTVDGPLFRSKVFDSCSTDCTEQIIQFHSELSKWCRHYCLIVHDDAAARLRLDRLADYLEQYGMYLIRQLEFRSAYYCSYRDGAVQERLTKTDVVGHISKQKESSRITVCCEPYQYIYFEEYVASFVDQMNANLLVTDEKRLLSHKYRPDQMYIFCQRMPRGKLDCPNKIVLNTEQMTILISYHAHCLKVKDAGVRMLDYSEFNSLVLGTECLPYQYNAYEVEKLRRYLAVPKKYDVAMVSNVYNRRKDIESKLRECGITVLNVVGWRDVRDKQIGQCRLLLNIHTHENAIVWEHLRCDRWLFAGMPIVSETCINTHDLDVREAVYWSTYDDIVDRVKEVLQLISSGSELLKLSDTIIQKRREQLERITVSIHSELEH